MNAIQQSVIGLALATGTSAAMTFSLADMQSGATMRLNSWSVNFAELSAVPEPAMCLRSRRHGKEWWPRESNIAQGRESRGDGRIRQAAVERKKRGKRGKTKKLEAPKLFLKED